MLHQQARTKDTPPPGFVTNHPHQHAFVLVGDETVFGVHMTQYHHEEHKYQLVMRLTLPPEAKEKLDTARARNPADSFVLCNDKSDEFMVPQLASGEKATFRANLFQGLPPFTEEDEADPHFFPWDLDRVIPLVPDIVVDVEHIVTFRPFAHHMPQPDYATFLLWGRGEEAHMTSLQTAHLASGKFEPPRFGPDYDLVMSLDKAPAWLDTPLLEAGIVVTVPALRLREYDELTGEVTHTIPCGYPFEPGEQITLLYRGMGASHTVTAGHTPLAGTAVCNSEGMVDCPPDKALMMSETPGGMLR